MGILRTTLWEMHGVVFISPLELYTLVAIKGLFSKVPLYEVNNSTFLPLFFLGGEEGTCIEM